MSISVVVVVFSRARFEKCCFFELENVIHKNVKKRHTHQLCSCYTFYSRWLSASQFFWSSNYTQIHLFVNSLVVHAAHFSLNRTDFFPPGDVRYKKRKQYAVKKNAFSNGHCQLAKRWTQAICTLFRYDWFTIFGRMEFEMEVHVDR